MLRYGKLTQKKKGGGISIAFADFGDIDRTIFEKIFQRYSLEYNCEVHIVEDNADYEICSVFGNSILKHRDNSIKIFYTGENLRPNFNLYDYAIGFDYLSFGDRYIRFPFYYTSDDSNVLTADKRNIDSSHTDKMFCSFVVSNGCSADPNREKLFRRLSEYKPVNSGGGFLNNVGGKVPDKLLFEKQHKFSLCCENASVMGYTTEKIVNAFAANTIPVYWGDPSICQVFNEKSFVNVLSYQSFDEVVQAVKAIDQNDALYESMLREPILTNDSFTRKHQLGFLYDFFCNIFNQDLQTAKRVSSFSYSNVYLREQKKLLYDHEKMEKLRSYIKPIKKIFSR